MTGAQPSVETGPRRRIATPEGPNGRFSLTRAIYRYAVVFFGLYLTASVFAFWPRYLSDPAGVEHPAVHVHGWLMASWLFLLVAQAGLIRWDRRDLHRWLGRVSYVLAPAVALSIALAAHVSIGRGEPTQIRLAQLALQLGYVPLFLAIYLLAMRSRADPPRHARFMLCTVLPMTSAVFDRILGFYLLPRLGFLPTFVDGSRLLPLIYILLIGLSIQDWRAHRRLDVFPVVSLLFLVQHATVLLVYRTAWWAEIGAWFAGL